MNNQKHLLISTLLGLMALSTSAIAGEAKKVTEQQVPKPVLEVFHKAYPQAQDLQYEKESKAGKTVYEVEFKDQGIKRKATYTGEGTLLETEEDIKPDALPASVTEWLKKAHPKATIEEAEKVMTPDGKVSGYEVEIKDGKKVLEIHFDAPAKFLRRKLRGNGTKPNSPRRSFDEGSLR